MFLCALKGGLSIISLQVTGYGSSGVGDINDEWTIHIVDGGADSLDADGEAGGASEGQYISRIRTTFRLVHHTPGVTRPCALYSDGVRLPKWGHEQVCVHAYVVSCCKQTQYCCLMSHLHPSVLHFYASSSTFLFSWFLCFYQIEVTCNPNLYETCTAWNVESHTNSLLPTGSPARVQPSFLSSLIEVKPLPSHIYIIYLSLSRVQLSFLGSILEVKP